MFLRRDVLDGVSLRRDYRSFDYLLLALVLVLCAFGAVMVFSAIGGHGDGYLAANPTIARIPRNHIIFLVSGVAVMLAAAFVDFRFICRFWVVFYLLNLFLLILVWVMGEIQGLSVSRWLNLNDFGIPVNMSIQPSEFNKLFSIIYLAMIVDKFKERLNELKVLALIVLAAMVPVALIIMQPSLSAGIVAFSIVVCALYAGGIRHMYVVIAFIVGGAFLGLMYHDLVAENQLLLHHLLPGGITENGIIHEWQLNRIRPMFGIEVDEALRQQNIQAAMALTAGGLFGNGFMNNPITVFVPHNDFIVAVIGAEFGFLGVMAVILLMMGIVYKCLYTAYKTPFFYAKIIASCVGVMFAFQAFLNVAVVMDIMPNTGVTFPFISAGGSSMWINLASIGLVMNIGMTKEKLMFED